MPRRRWRRCARAGLRAEADLRNEKINYKVREHSLAKVPVILAVGLREVEERTVSIRRLGEKESRVRRRSTPPSPSWRRRRRRPTCAEGMAGLRHRVWRTARWAGPDSSVRRAVAGPREGRTRSHDPQPHILPAHSWRLEDAQERRPRRGGRSRQPLARAERPGAPRDQRRRLRRRSTRTDLTGGAACAAALAGVSP